jgi:predicted house-cleaning noncanonical NTP pyrophosphatase (MazG superfamily)
MNNSKIYRFSCQKLVRDKSAEVFSQKGISSVSRRLNLQDYQQALKTKLIEVQEVVDAHTPQELCAEIADVQEVLDALIQAYNLSTNEIKQIRETKKTKIGGFANGLYIDHIEVPDGHRDLAYFLAKKHKYPQF